MGDSLNGLIGEAPEVTNLQLQVVIGPNWTLLLHYSNNFTVNMRSNERIFTRRKSMKLVLTVLNSQKASESP